MDATSDRGVCSYGKVWNIEDKTVIEQFEGLDVVVEEKVDGSQFSFGLLDGEVRMRSKGVEVFDGDAGMFAEACRHVRSIARELHDGVVIRCEYLSKAKHNTIAYGRVPDGHLVLLDVECPGYAYMDSRAALEGIAESMGIDIVPELYRGPLPTIERLAEMADRESFLGGANVEGVVIKARSHRHRDGKMLKAKFVRADFKERHRKGWRSRQPTQSDTVQAIGESLCTEARFRKAVESLRDAGVLDGSVRDIGPLMKKLGTDLFDEQSEYVKGELYKAFWPTIARRANRGFPDWYKRQLSEATP